MMLKEPKIQTKRALLAAGRAPDWAGMVLEFVGLTKTTKRGEGKESWGEIHSAVLRSAWKERRPFGPDSSVHSGSSSKTLDPPPAQAPELLFLQVTAFQESEESR